MANSTLPQLTQEEVTQAGDMNTQDSAALCSDRDAATAPSVALDASAPWAAFSMFSDSLRLLGCFFVGRDGRLSRKKSAQLCDLMNAWN